MKKTLLFLLIALFTPVSTSWCLNYHDFFTSICRNDLEAVKRLSPRGSGLNAVDLSSGATPLTWASMKGIRPEIAEWMINNGASLNKLDGEGNTPLTTAAAYGNVAVTKLLLRYGADPNKTDNRKNHPLVIASGRNGKLEIVKALIDKGARGNGETGEKAAEAALAFGNTDILDFFLRRGIKPGYFKSVKAIFRNK